MTQKEKHQTFTDLLQAHHTQLFGYLYALVHNISDAEDLYQETSAVLWRKFGEYREGTSFFSWARVAARFETLNFIRRRKRSAQFSAELEAQLSDDFNELNDDLLEARLDALRECKNRLGKRDLELVEACYGSRQTLRETAENLHRSAKSVYDALGRIRNVLMKCIEATLAEKGQRT